jgi:meiotically up-regulated gene 157 (Mug157) protein
MFLIVVFVLSLVSMTALVYMNSSLEPTLGRSNAIVNIPSTLETIGGKGASFLRGAGNFAGSNQAALKKAAWARRLPPSVWTRKADPHPTADATAIQEFVRQNLTAAEMDRARKLCGQFLYSSLTRATQVGDLGSQTFVATGDIPYMWTRDSAVQMGLYVPRIQHQPWLNLIIQGAIRRQAFHIIQDPYGNAYTRSWQNPRSLPLKDRVIGRGGWVATRNYEVDSGAYFITQLWDYYVSDVYRPEILLAEPIVFDAVQTLVDTYIIEQHHERDSSYRYLELPRDGKGKETAYTGMTWSGFRPSDEACDLHYHVPSNIYAAAALERAIVLNQQIWRDATLHNKMQKLLLEIEEGIQKHGTIQMDSGETVYAYEVDGLGNSLEDFDDANVPSLLSIPVLGWSKFDPQVYENTRQRLLNPKLNKHYYANHAFRGMGSSHTPHQYVWPMSFAMEALTLSGTPQQRAHAVAFQLRQSLQAACQDAAHESVDSNSGCTDSGSGMTRNWFEWSNALFVVLTEMALGEQCDATGRDGYRNSVVYTKGSQETMNFYQNRYQSDPAVPGNYQVREI